MIAILKHGDTEPLLVANQYRTVIDGLDTASLEYEGCTNRDAFTFGQAAPGYAGLYIDAVDHEQDGDEWRLKLGCSGISGNHGIRQSLGYPKISENLEEWDRVEDEVVSANRNYFRQGGFGIGYGGTMVCISAGAEPINRSKTYWRCRGSFLGIITPKPYKRQITCGNQVVTGDEIIWNLEGGWATASKASVALAAPIVSDTYLSTFPPRTGAIPGSSTPPNAPLVRVINATVSNPRKYWPNGWELTVSSRQIAGVQLFENTYTYRWQYKVLPD